MTTATVTTTYEVEPKPNQGDPAFYVWGANAHELVATVKYGDREIRVFCDGEMRLHVWESKESRERGDSPEVVRYCDRLEGAGINSDEDIIKADEEGRLEWVNNAWFDLYAYGEGITDGWLDCVDHDLVSAVKGAEELITNDEFWGGVK